MGQSHGFGVRTNLKEGNHLKPVQQLSRVSLICASAAFIAREAMQIKRTPCPPLQLLTPDVDRANLVSHKHT